MTTKTSTLILAFAAAAIPFTGLAAASSNIAGFVKKTVPISGNTLYGLNLFKPDVYCGDADISGTTVTIAGLTLDSATDYIVIVTDGADEGENALVVSQTGDDITVSKSLATSGTAQVCVYPLFTFGEVFGTGADIELESGAQISIPQGGGAFTTYTVIFDPFAGGNAWSGGDVNAPLIPGVGMLIRRGSTPAADVSVTIAGVVLEEPFKLDLEGRANLVANVYPAVQPSDPTLSTETVDNSGLTDDLATGDIITFVPSGAAPISGTLVFDPFAGGATWSGDISGASELPLDGGYFIQKSVAGSVTLTPSF